MPLRNYLDKVRRYFWYTPRELLGLGTVTVIFAFIFSFRQWGEEAFDTSAGLQNLGEAIVLAAICLLVYTGCQRLVALKAGCQPEHAMSWNGLLLSLAAAFITNGHIGVYAATSVSLKPLTYHRLGIKPTGIGLKTFALAAIAGPLGILLFGGLVRTVFPGAEWAENVLKFSLLLAFWNMLPIPPLDGSRLLFASRLTYIFMLATLASIAGLAQWVGSGALFAGLAIGSIIWYLYYDHFERQA
jgi:Zn-dependent protease